jgi:hypothetical protein
MVSIQFTDCTTNYSPIQGSCTHQALPTPPQTGSPFLPSLRQQYHQTYIPPNVIQCLAFFLNPSAAKDEGSAFHQNISKHSPSATVPQTTRPKSSTKPMQKPQSHNSSSWTQGSLKASNNHTAGKKLNLETNRCGCTSLCSSFNL